MKTFGIFHISAQNIDCGYSLEPSWRGGSNAYQNLCFWAEIGKLMCILIRAFSDLKKKPSDIYWLAALAAFSQRPQINKKALNSQRRLGLCVSLQTPVWFKGVFSWWSLQTM